MTGQRNSKKDSWKYSLSSLVLALWRETSFSRETKSISIEGIYFGVWYVANVLHDRGSLSDIEKAILFWRLPPKPIQHKFAYHNATV